MSDFENRVHDYLTHDSSICPICGSEDLDYGSGDFGSEASQEVSCGDCGSVWNDTYQLDGIEIIQIGHKIDDPAIRMERYPLIQRWLVIAEPGTTPILDGPYESDAARREAARAHLEATGSREQLSKLDIGQGGSTDITPFISEELEGEKHP